MKRWYVFFCIGMMLSVPEGEVQALSSTTSLQQRVAARRSIRRARFLKPEYRELQKLTPHAHRPLRLTRQRKTTNILRAASSRPKSSFQQFQASIVPRLVFRELKQEVIRLTNAERAPFGLPPLQQNAFLDAAAQTHANDMANRGYFRHVSPEGRSHVDRVQATGYKNGSASPRENIASAKKTPAEAVQAWMKSYIHRLNIYSEQHSNIGIGINGKIWVQVFGS